MATRRSEPSGDGEGHGSQGPEDQLDAAKVEAELRGKTLLAYWYILRRGSAPVGVREVQRALSLSSPSVALHHLEKLRGLGLLRKAPGGEYLLESEVKVGFLRLFTRIGRLMVPRYLFYSVLFTTIFAGYVALYPQTLDLHNLMALILGALATGIFWFETQKTLREAPF